MAAGLPIDRQETTEIREEIGSFTASASGVLHVLLAPLNAARHAHRFTWEGGGGLLISSCKCRSQPHLLAFAQLRKTALQSKGHTGGSGITCSGFHSDVLSAIIRGTSSFTRNT